MSENRELHVRRLHAAHARIAQWREGHDNALSAEFEAWQERTSHSLQVLFGKEHAYTRAFGSLSFWLTRVSIGGPVRWSPQDQERFLADLLLAEHTLTDAMEELPSLPSAVASTGPATATVAPSVIVNVSNVLSQVTTLSVSQIVAQIGSLPLDAAAKAQAQQAAQDLRNEIDGQQRWPLMAKSLEVLKVLGKGAYEKIALPLLLELIKKQAGLP